MKELPNRDVKAIWKMGKFCNKDIRLPVRKRTSASAPFPIDSLIIPTWV